MLFSGILFLLVVGFLEISLQLFYFANAGDWLAKRTGLPIFEEDPTRCYRLKSNLEYLHATNEFNTWIYTNSQGMRTDSRRLDVSIEKPDDVYRTVRNVAPDLIVHFGGLLWRSIGSVGYPTVRGWSGGGHRFL